ncbi:hypothetical protein Q1695_005781 [Nippostrongylus brasiliensis]|nr:hypothetical protein Q1695_005781 [Nippostrongylus brasiliensis]
MMSDIERRILLEDVNRLRREAAIGLMDSFDVKIPKAENMYKVSWDCGLESLAQKTAERCPHVKTPHPVFGQAFVYYGASVDMSRKRHVVHDAVTRLFRPEYVLTEGHDKNDEMLNFLNLIRGNTTRIGCSQQLCQTLDGYLTATGVCYFNSPDLGNGDLIYKKGEPCATDADCTTHVADSVCDRFLCAHNRFAAEVVRLHNDCRSELALGRVVKETGQALPHGANILQMRYDFDLEKEAQNAVRRCADERSGPMISFSTAETLWANRAEVSLADVTNKLEAVQTAIISWWEQITSRNKFGVRLVFRSFHLHQPISEFTQMAWATTGTVACAVEKCTKKSYDVVCLYKQRGNIVDHLVYAKGTPCSMCPFDTTCDPENGLCVQSL